MSVAPDLLLNTATDIKARSAPAKSQARAAEPSRNDASSFSQVYARERQAQVAERRDAAAQQARERQAQDAQVKEPAPQVAAEAEEVADSGNDLPEDEQENTGLDSLLLFGMTGDVPVNTLTDEQALAATQSLRSSGPATLTEASLDPEQEALNQIPAVQMALNIGAQSQAAQEADATDGLTAFAGDLLSEETSSKEAALDMSDLDLQGLSGKSLEALKEGTANNTPENFVSKLNALSQAVSQQTTAARAPLFGQPVSMQQSGWSEAVVDRVMLMSSQNLKTAEIQLDPAELGRLEIRISVTQEQSQVTFASPHAGVRDALDSQMHRLRELFAQQGMNQLDVNVSDQSLSRGWQGSGGEGEGGQRGQGGDALLGAEDNQHGAGSEVAPQVAQRARSLVDYYA